MTRLPLLCTLLCGVLLLPAATAQERSASDTDQRVPVVTRATDEARPLAGKPDAERPPRYRAVPGTERLVLTPEGLAEARAFAATKQRVAAPERTAVQRPVLPDGKTERPVSAAASAYLADVVQQRLASPPAQREVEAGFSGSNSGGPTFARPSSVGSGTSGSCSVASAATYRYQVEAFDVSESGSYDIFASYDGYDGYLLLYAGSFSASDPCRNLVALDDDFNGTGASLIENVSLSVGTTYRAVVTTFSSASAGGPYTGHVAETGLLPTVFVVDNIFDDEDSPDASPGDGICADGLSDCGLRTAIQEANATGGSAPVFIAFDIGTSISVRTITLGSELPSVERSNVTIDGLTQPGASCGNLVAGSSHTLRVVLNGSSTTSGNGLANTFDGTALTVRGLAIQNFAFGFGLFFSTDDALVECNYVGTDVTGETAAGNLNGVYAGGTIRNNLVSGNLDTGILPRPFGAGGTVITRNLVGTDDDGNQPLGNGDDGIAVGSTNTVITTNLVSANSDDGIQLGQFPLGFSSSIASGTVMTGNTIGLTRNRTAALGNDYGVYFIDGTSDNDLGLPGNGNFIGGNAVDGVLVSLSNDNDIVANTIGRTASGNPAPNGDGIDIGAGASNLRIGVASSGNVVADNDDEGIGAFAATGITLRNNQVLGNGAAGIDLSSVTAPTLNGNTVSGNGGSGIVLRNGTTGAVAENNRIGTGTNGTTSLPNTLSGLVLLDAGTTGATVTGNTISANTDAGVFLSGGTSGHVFENNFIGTSASSTNLGNGLAGIFCQDATNVRIGKNFSANTIRFNAGDGVFLAPACQNISIVGNVIFGNGDLAVDLAPNGVNPNDPGDADTGANQKLNFPVITSAGNNGANAVIAFTLNARPNTTYQLLFCRLPAPDPSNHGECNDPNALRTVTTNGSGNASGTLTIGSSAYPVGSWVTANATEVVGALPAGYRATSEFGRARQVQDTSGPALTATITPTNPTPPVVLQRGDRVFFDVTFDVGPSGPSSFQYWTEAVLPNGVVRSPLIGPNTVNLTPPQTVTFSFSQRVPGVAPTGSYTYRLKAGTFPNTVIDSDAFAAQIVPGRVAGAPDVWQAFDADGRLLDGPLTHDLTGDPSGDTAEAASRGEAALPSEVTLAGAYPNPFSRQATVGFALPEAQRVTLAVYDVLGRAVATLVDDEVEAGHHEAVLDGAALPSGVYLVRLVSGNRTETQRLTLVR